MADYPNLFDKSDPDCIEHVDKVNFDFVETCDITQLPAPIFDCPFPIVLPEPDTEVGLKCPIFSEINSEIRVGVRGRSGTTADGVCENPSIPQFQMSVVKKDVDPCDYIIDVNLDVPLPPPPCEVSLEPGDVNIEVGFQDCVASYGALAIDKVIIPYTDRGDCDSPDECKYKFDLDLFIGVPRTECPAINVNTFSVRSGFSDPYDIETCNGESRFSITRNVITGDCDTPDQCEFDVDLEIYIPIPKPSCPEITVRDFSVVGLYNKINPATGQTICPVQSRFNITPVITPGDCNTADTCDFIVDLEIAVPIPPPPCPNISVQTFTVRAGYDDPQNGCLIGQNVFRITKEETPGDCLTPDRCDFLVDLELFIPIPKPPCVNIVNRSREDFVRVLYDEQTCVNDGPRFEITSQHIPGDCTTPDRCEWSVFLDLPIYIPKPPCVNVINRSSEDFVRVNLRTQRA